MTGIETSKDDMTTMNSPARCDVRLLTWIRCGTDDLDHAVIQEELAHGVFTHAGRFSAVCGHMVIPGSMLQPPGAPCPQCAPLAAESDRSRKRADQHREGAIGRWLNTVVGAGRCRDAADVVSPDGRAAREGRRP